jgi:hypothetical protein
MLASRGARAAEIPEAPFGLRWLASSDDIDKMGVRCGRHFSSPFGESCTVAELPKDVPDLTYAVLFFGYDDRLIRVLAVGGAFPGDHDGKRLTARYRELEQLLEKKYGQGDQNSHTEKGFDGDRFELGLRLKKNWMYTVFEPRDMKIELSAVFDQNATRWRLIFEYGPGMDELERERARMEQEAL